MKKTIVVLTLAAFGLALTAGPSLAALSKITGNVGDDSMRYTIASEKYSFKVYNSNYANVDVETQSWANSGENKVNVAEDATGVVITAGDAEAESTLGMDVNSLEIDDECCDVDPDEATAEISLNDDDDADDYAEATIDVEEDVNNENNVDFEQLASADGQSGANEINVGEDLETAQVGSGKSASNLIKTDFLNWFKWSKSKM